MPVTEIDDPRLHALFGASDPREAGVRPTVRLPRKGLPPIALAVIAVVFALLLFLVLNAKRTSQREPAVAVQPDSSAAVWTAPPPLYVPPVPGAALAPVIAAPEVVEQPRPTVIVANPAPAPRDVQPQIVYTRQPVPQMIAPPLPMPPQRVSSGSPLVIDTGSAMGSGAGPSPNAIPSIAGSSSPVSRMRASAFANQSTTVPQGTIIPAVLETGFDSTKPGFARAIVSRDVRGFDGKSVLIPRGSRLVGEYHADIGQSQKRAVITWTRLIRPDGMTIAMDSPAVDTVGRGGVPAHVNTHFLQRVGDALLQSTIGLGGALAQRAVAGPVLVLSGNQLAGASQLTPTSRYVPTLTVAPGKSISVFVAHDLDFSAAAGER